MLDPDLAAHLAKTPSLQEFDDWAAVFGRYGPSTLPIVACGAAASAYQTWANYDHSDAHEWQRGRLVTRVLRRLLTWLDDRSRALDATFVAEVEQLSDEVDNMSVYVSETGGTEDTCEGRERTLAAARAVLAAARSVVWSPAAVTHTIDEDERLGRIEAGPFDEMLEACKCAVRATYAPDSPKAVVKVIREAITMTFGSSTQPR